MQVDRNKKDTQNTQTDKATGRKQTPKTQTKKTTMDKNTNEQSLSARILLTSLKASVHIPASYKRKTSSKIYIIYLHMNIVVSHEYLGSLTTT